MPGPLLLALYLLVTLTPLVLSWALGLPPRPILDELSSGLAMLAFAVLLIEFLLSGRFRTISSGIGIDRTMRYHQLFARSMLVLVLVHPFLYSLPVLAHGLPWDPTAAEYLRLDGATLFTGGAAWVLIFVLVLTGIARDALPYRYETWRLGHGIGAVLVAGFTAHHVLEAGRYAAHPQVAWAWYTLMSLAAATLLYVYFMAPLLKLARRFEVLSVRKIADRTWELVIGRKDGKPFAFEAGQFAWISLAPGPFTLAENPFSIASAPFDGTKVGFVIKEVGDFTRSLAQVRPGQPAWVDGPHGSMRLPGSEAPGIGLIGGGVGVAPLLSVIRQMHAAGDPRPVVLLYGNRVESQITYREELDQLSALPNVHVLHVLSEPPAGWTGATGMIDLDTISRALEGLEDTTAWTFLLCGPPPMLESAEAALIDLGVPPKQIRSERFVYD